MKLLCFATSVALLLLLVGCSDDSDIEYQLNCSVYWWGVVEGVKGSSDAVRARKAEASHEASEMCTCNAKQVLASKEISRSERRSFFRKLTIDKSISSGSRTKIMQILDKCGRKFARLLLLLKKDANQWQ